MKRFGIGILLVLSFVTYSFAEKEAFKVALLTTGPVTDGGWNASAYEGLRLIENNLGAETSQMETHTPLEFEEGFREYAKLGYDLVIGHGFEFQDAALKVGRSYPQTVFLVSAGNKTAGQNVSPVSFELGEATYLLGMVAGNLSETGVVGVIGGMALPPVKKAFDGFRAGFSSVRPDGKVLETYLGSWEDVSGAKEAALAQMRQNADFIIHNADAAAWGIVQAARSKKNVGVFGTNRDQTKEAPEVIWASAVCDIPAVLYRNAEKVKAGNFMPREAPYGLKENGVWIAYTPEFKKRLSASLIQELDRQKEKFLSGEITY